MDPPEERQRLTKYDDLPTIQMEPGVVRLDVPEYNIRGMKKSTSISSMSNHIREKFRAKRQKFRQNQCAGIVTFLILGTILNVLAYLASVWAAQLQAEVVRTAVENEHTFRFKLKRTLAEAPSKYLIGLLNFGGRVLSALGIVMLVQVVSTYLKRRRYSVLVKSAAEEADTFIAFNIRAYREYLPTYVKLRNCDMHIGMTDTVGECCMSCFQALT